jgi:hypothetical protein
MILASIHNFVEDTIYVYHDLPMANIGGAQTNMVIKQ